MLLFCSLWKKRQALFCSIWSPSSNTRAPSEGDSAGSCGYAPPNYSRCNSFYQNPPPYFEVASKPDLYPLIFSYSNDGSKSNGANYLMVQYFRNYCNIVRPIGSLSATSTVDSLSSSSFVCTANEENTMVPPPYSSATSPDGLPISLQNYSVQRSASQLVKKPIAPIDMTHLEGYSVSNTRPMSVPNTNDYFQRTNNQFRMSESANFCQTDEDSYNFTYQNHHLPSSNSSVTVTQSTKKRNENVISDDDEYQLATSSNSIGNRANGINLDEVNQVPSVYHSNDTMLSLSAAMMDKISYSRQTNDHTKLNMIQKQLEKCCEMIQQQQEQIQQTQSHFYVTTSYDSEMGIPLMGITINSNTGSTLSSLANLNSPVSPPQATSPTQEVKELLAQIRHLKNATKFSDESLNNGQINEMKPRTSTEITNDLKSIRPTTFSSQKKIFSMRNRSTYFPIAKNSLTSPGGLSTNAKTRYMLNRKGWISKSAPTTPAGLPSNFMEDNSPLLNEQDEDAY